MRAWKNLLKAATPSTMRTAMMEYLIYGEETMQNPREHIGHRGTEGVSLAEIQHFLLNMHIQREGVLGDNRQR